jgi:NtrC-family two-component system response regulator AlgB
MRRACPDSRSAADIGRSAARVSNAQAIVAALLAPENPSMQRALATLRRAAETDLPILLVGETGTGKRLLAEAVHRWSRRERGPFVVLPCADLGAGGSAAPGIRSRRWRARVRRMLRAAADGTVLLEEVERLSPGMQAEAAGLLGDVACPEPDAPVPRLLGAATTSLETAMRAGRLRHDLYFRLSVVTIMVPPLRARPEDLLVLTDRLVAHFAARSGRAPMTVTPEARRALAGYEWPTNVRQLANVLERAVALARGETIGPAELPAWVVAPESRPTDGGTLGELERREVRRAMAESPTLREAAARLGIDRTSLWRMRKRWLLE